MSQIAHESVRTHLEIIHEIGDREAADDDSHRKERVFERTHIRTAAVLIFYLYVIGVFVAARLLQAPRRQEPPKRTRR